MNSDQLLKFIAIADHPTMTEAADSLYITQSALSHTLTNLESELNCKLFLRNGKNLIITENGVKLLEYARSITSLVNQAVLEISSSEKLNIAAINICAAYILANYPEDKLHNVGLLQLKEEEMPMALMKEDVDIIACDDFYLRHYNIPALRKFVLCREQLGLLVPNGHRFYNRRSVNYSDLRDEPLCMRADFRSQRTWMDHIEQASGIKFNIAFNMDRYTFLTLRDKIDYPEIRTVTSVTKLNNPSDKDYKYVKIDDTYSSRFIYMWYLAGNTKKVDAVIESVKAYYRAGSGMYRDKLVDSLSMEDPESLKSALRTPYN